MRGHFHQLCALLFFMSLLTACMSHLNLHEGILSFQAQDYRQAFIRLKPEAEKGQPDAQYAVGYMYYYGQGVVENRRQALIWIERAAHSGQRDAIAAIHLLDHGPVLKPLFNPVQQS